MLRLYNHLSQVYPPKPTFTERNVPSLHGKVYVVTGANTGIGKELAQILYANHAKVYVATRSADKAAAAIADIKKANPESAGELVFVHLDLADLNSVRIAGREIAERERRIHVLFNNAGVMLPPDGRTTAQGYDMQLGVNNIGTHLFTKLLTPRLVETAQAEASTAPGSVRVVWVSSSAAETQFVPRGGVDLENIDFRAPGKNVPALFSRYGISKAGNYLQGAEYARRHKIDGVISIPLNPGNLNSDLWREQGPVMGMIIKAVLLHPPIYGAYTELFAGLSPKVTMERSGSWVIPWGRFGDVRQDLKESTKTKEEGGTGVAALYWDWLEEQIRPYL